MKNLLKITLIVITCTTAVTISAGVSVYNALAEDIQFYQEAIGGCQPSFSVAGGNTYAESAGEANMRTAYTLKNRNGVEMFSIKALSSPGHRHIVVYPVWPRDAMVIPSPAGGSWGIIESPAAAPSTSLIRPNKQLTMKNIEVTPGLTIPMPTTTSPDLSKTAAAIGA